MKVDLGDQGAIIFPPQEQVHEHAGLSTAALLHAPLAELEPALARDSRVAFLLKERSVDPQALAAATVKAAKHRGVDFSSGDPAISVNLSNGSVTGLTTTKTTFLAPKVINCAGAWAGQIAPHKFPTRPVKGQMLSLAPPSPPPLSHVGRAPEVYLIPRSGGRIVGATTLQRVGCAKRT